MAEQPGVRTSRVSASLRICPGHKKTETLMHGTRHAMNVTGERNDAMERSRRVVIAQDGPSLATTPNEDPEVLGKKSALRRLHDPASNSLSREDLAEDDDLECDSLTDTGDPQSSDNSISNEDEPNQGSVVTSSDNEAESHDDDETETIQDLPPLTEYTQEQECPPLAQIITSKLGEFARNVGEGSQWMRAHEDQGPYHSRVFAKLPTRLLLASLVEPILEELQQHGIIITRESYFKNAFSIFPELITRGRDVSACEALLVMTAFMQCTADTQITLQLSAAASRLVQTLGLHRRDFYSSLDVPTAQRHQWVFWATYVLEVEMMDKYGCGSGLACGETPVGLPLRCSSSSCVAREACKCSRLLRWRSELAIIQRRIHDQLHPEAPVFPDRDGLLRIVCSINEQLLAWKRGLPEDMSTKTHQHRPDLHTSMALLLYNFHSSVSRVNTALTGLLLTVDVTKGNFMLSPLGRIHAIAGERLGGDGCDVNRLLGGCRKLHDIASFARSAVQEADHQQDAETTVRRSAMLAQLEATRQKLSGVKDWLQLALGFLSNLPMLRKEAEAAFSDIFGGDVLEGVYGRFVPDLFKSHANNFAFNA
ncbi:hypothetical protein B0J15DRAFT_509923 [Fusarium solani]|uniref:Xylanolytic transcriptional activator regulatory domain-containing protein n=1 Tax=Fusarium solani TaxID=169388 RepID=A0A9P9KT07_FUSSL|nr:uncharacterized protein B0J15DRAFT_509923 [Fusarium solani]KAH7267964.1 hypothetical protein B0J15DRAFT_509923 [Fusarium solani]